MLHTTITLLREYGACKDRFEVLLKALGEDKKDEGKLIPLLFILKSNRLDDALWSLRATTEPCDKMTRLLACHFAERVVYLFETAYPGDGRVRDCISVARRFAMGEATCRELAAAARSAEAATEKAWDTKAATWAACDAAKAAHSAAWNDASFAACSTASFATCNASWNAAAAKAAAALDARDAGDAVREAAAHDAWETERKWQEARFLEVLSGKNIGY